MKSVPLKDLKSNLSHWTEEASKGTDIIVTRYNRPYIRLTTGVEPHLHRGEKAGKAELRPIGHRLTQGKWLKYLEEDRNED
ncbi:MAG: type II toxin-antitoxin system Phd/YefM family antitoxin [Deltaproteobacteria bacterium]|nr:type II toxin-antitoxin system Phd/YefM family antitoxin [Deltaproteobacteria bacterium]